MKKVIFAAIAVMTFGLANAQDVKFGLKGGVNLSSFAGDVENTKSKVGFQVGGFAEFKLTDKFFVQPEVMYSLQGAKYQQSEVNYYSKGNIAMSYLNIPVMAKYYIIDKLNIEAGPQIGFLLSAKDKWEESYNGVKDSGKDDVKDSFKSVSLGLNVGVGYDFTENLSAGIRYNVGLSNILDTEGDYKAHNNVLTLAVGYKF